MPVYPPDTAAWLDTPTGLRLRRAEQSAAKDALRRVFGAQFLQVGLWGESDEFTPLTGTARRAVCARREAAGVSFVAEDWQLPVSAHAIDAILLPHTLERSRDPHQLLRECERVMTGGGRLILLGFNPWSFVGLRRLLGRGAWPPGIEQVYSERRLRDWLSLLNFDVTDVRRYFPLLADQESQLRRPGPAIPGYFGAYVLTAVKRVHVVTPLKTLWRRPAAVGGRLVEPTTRSRL
jgi:SAM-dependent methyltransferase